MSLDSDRGAGEVRRDTPLARLIARHIADVGPITVREYMTICLSHPEHGYYRARDAIGAGGDFITAPEISQVFGELLGLWAAVVWQRMGAPSSFQLAEVGPGRGTMIADALRAAQRVKGFADAARIVLVEASPVLQEAQRKTLKRVAIDVRWATAVSEVAPGPCVLLANEFLDVVPIMQLIRVGDGWRERTVTLDEQGALAFGLGAKLWQGALPSIADTATVGALLELRDLGETASALASIAEGGPLAALFIDYGHEVTGFGDTLQAVRQHRTEHPLASPGEADLTAMVDFEVAASVFASAGLAVERLVTQAEFLGALGVAERASRLMAANPSRAGEIEMGVARLMAPHAMGTRFKVLGVRSLGLPVMPAFPAT